MIVTSPFGLLALLAIPVIIGIHLFRRRFPERTVAGLFLWSTERQSPDGGDRRERLPITASLLLECIAALALALILGGVRLSSDAVSEHLVVVLDDSASMSAADADGERARDRALRFVAGELERLGSRGRITLIRSGERPAVLVGPSALAIEARGALDGWDPQAPHHGWSVTLQLARELAGLTGTLVVLSDGAPGSAADAHNARWIAVGRPLPNVGIIGAERTLDPSRGGGAISLTLGNFSAEAATRRLRVTAAGAEILGRDLSLPPGVSSMNLPLPAGLPVAQVSMDPDALQRDNEVVLVEPRPQIVAVHDALPPGRGRDALEKAIEALSGVTRATPGHLAFVDAPELGTPLSHSRSSTAAAATGVWRVGIGAPATPVRAAGEADDFIGPFTIEKRHPLLAGATLDGVVWAGAAPVSADAAHPLASAGDRLLIGAIGNASGERAYLFNLDLQRTNLIRAPDWPILISNLVEMRRQELPGPSRWNYRVGEWVQVRLDHPPAGQLRWRAGAIERPLTRERLLQFVPPAPGVAEILDGNAVLFSIGVNFLDDVESDLRGRAASDSGMPEGPSRGMRAETGSAFDPLYWIFLTVAATALLGNWWLLGARAAQA